MTRRWIIRTAVILAFLFCIGFWIDSYAESCSAQYVSSSTRSIEIDSLWGAVYIRLDEREPYTAKGMHFSAGTYDHGPLFAPNWRRAGFDWDTFSNGPWGRRIFIGIPFWFPSLGCMGLLWLAWRKTRPKPKGFPVEVKQAAVAAVESESNGIA